MDEHKARGIHARSSQFARYEQVEKRRDYHLAEHAECEEFDEEYRIHSCDLGRFLHGNAGDRARFSRELGAALEDIGFAILENTGIDPGLYDEAVQRTMELFVETPLERKLEFAARRHGSVNQGYFPIKETSEIHPDLVEGWVFCRRAFDLDPGRPVALDEFWPYPDMEPFFRGMCQQHERLIQPLMQAILGYLGLDPRAFDDRLAGTNFGLRLNYYPPVTRSDAATRAGRLLGHEDVDLFTLLPAPQVEGLQVLNRENKKWIRLIAPRGALIVNNGDYLQRITNDRLPSTTHRVAQPRDPAMLERPRVSFPLNVYLWEDEMLEVLPGLGTPKYEPVKAIHFHTAITSKYYGDDYQVDD